VLLPPGGYRPAINKYIISYHIISYRIVSYRIVSYRIVSYHIISYHIISYHVIFYIISYHVISYHIISYHAISYHIYHIILYCNWACKQTIPFLYLQPFSWKWTQSFETWRKHPKIKILVERVVFCGYILHDYITMHGVKTWNIKTMHFPTTVQNVIQAIWQ